MTAGARAIRASENPSTRSRARTGAGREQPRRRRERADDGLGRDAARAQLRERRRPRALREALAAGREHERHVRERRRRRAERGIERELARRRRQQIVAAHDARDLHRRVVDDDGELVRRRAVGASKHEVVDALRARGHFAVQEVDERQPRASSVEADRGRASLRRRARLDLGDGNTAARAGIAWALVVARVGRARGARDVGARARARERAPRGQQPRDGLVVARDALALPIRPPRAALLRPLVPIEPEPAQIVEEARLGVGDHARAIEVLDAHDEGRVRGARVEPRQQRRARVAEVDGARRARGVSSSLGGHQFMPELKRALGPVMLWGLGVGYVISGMYFGWNLGLPLGGTWGMLAATVVATILYVTFIFSYTELSCAIPRAGGAFDFGLRAFGPTGGLVLGVAQIVEFLFAPPAIAAAIGAYFNLFFPTISPVAIAIVAYVVFTAINIWGVKQAAAFELFITIAAVGELVLFMAVTAPHFHAANLAKDGLPQGWGGAFACLPFAVWMYLGIEGVANVAEEARDPHRDISRGFGWAMATLVVLGLGVFVTSVGVAGWHAVVYPSPGAAPSDSPLPLALSHVVSGRGAMFHLLVTVGLFGLVASFHGIVLAAGRAALELGRTGYAPAFIGRVHPRTGTPAAALIVNAVIGVAAILSSRTGDLIVLSGFGALTLYALSMVALFRLRRLEPALPRPFRAVAYPLFPAIALGLALVSLVAMVWTNRAVALVYAAILVGAGAYWKIFGGQPRVARAPQ